MSLIKAACFSPPRNTSNTLTSFDDAVPNAASESDIRSAVPVPARRVRLGLFRGSGRETTSLLSRTLVLQKDKIHILDIQIKLARPVVLNQETSPSEPAKEFAKVSGFGGNRRGCIRDEPGTTPSLSVDHFELTCWWRACIRRHAILAPKMASHPLVAS